MKKIISLALLFLSIVINAQPGPVTPLNVVQYPSNTVNTNTFSIGNKANRSMYIKTNDVYRIKLDSIGRVSILGTNTLNVGPGSHTYNPGGIMSVYNATGTAVSTIYTGTNNGYSQFSMGANTSTSATIFFHAGSGITSSGIYFKNSGYIQTFSELYTIDNAASSGSIVLATQSSERLRITSTGVKTTGAGTVTGSFHVGPANPDLQTTLSKFRLSNSSSSILDIGNGNVANAVYFWANRPGSKTTSNYNMYMDEYDLLLNDSASIQFRLQNVTVLNVNNQKLFNTTQDLFKITAIPFVTNSLTERRKFYVTSRTVGFGATGTLASQRDCWIEATTYTSTGATVLTEATALKVDAGIASTNVTITTNNAIWSNGTLKVSGRINANQGADVASATGSIALGTDGSVFEITGTNAITLINSVGYQNGSEITLLFTSTASLTDGTANSGTLIGFELAGNTNFTGSADDSITLVLCEIGGTVRWREKCRSVN